MTLVLHWTDPRHVAHVSDRRLTLTPTGRLFDARANKTILFTARDAMVVLGYSGLAYASATETMDQWIASVLAGTSLTDTVSPVPGHPDVGLTYKGYRREPHDGLGSSLARLTRAIDDLASGKRAKFGASSLWIVAAGWQWKLRGPYRPHAIEAQILYSQGKAYLRMTRVPYGEASLRYCGQYSMDELRALQPNVVGVPKEERAGVLASALRRYSASHAGVGSDAMVVQLRPPPARPHPRGECYLTPGGLPPELRPLLSCDVRYEADQHGTAVMGGIEYPVAYGPWIVDNFSVVPPLRLIGGGYGYRNTTYAIACWGMPAAGRVVPESSIVWSGSREDPPIGV